MAAAPQLPDPDELELEYLALERRAADVQRSHAKIIDRMTAFPSEFTAMQERVIAAKLDAMVARLTQLEAQLLSYGRRPGFDASTA
jgi:hypothetical protein